MRKRTALLIAIAAGIAVMLLTASDTVDALELPVRDFALRLLPPRDATMTIVAGIDEESLRATGPWPWERTVLAAIVNRAADAGARGVVLDILLADPRPGDEQLAAAARRIPTLAVSALDEQGQWHLPVPALAAMTPVHGNFEIDHDGIVRRFSATKQNADRSLVALSVEASSLITGAPVPVGRTLAPAFRTRPGKIPTISAAALIRNGTGASQLRGKLVFVGPVAIALGDRVLTPTSSRRVANPGVTVHAAATESLIRGDVIRELAPINSGAFTAIAIGALAILRRRRIVTVAAIIVIIAGGLLLLGDGIAIPFATMLAAVILTSAAFEAQTLIAALASSEARFIVHRERDAESKRVLAHELKTPLASMRNLTQLLGLFELSDAERQRVTSLLAQEAGKLETMVGTLLDLERLPLRDFVVSSRIVDLGALAAARVDFLRASTDRTLLVTAEPGLLVRADAALIERVIDNLVGNALKYTSGAISVTVSRAGHDAILQVEDRGPGIAEGDRARIFERFVRGTSAAGTQGLGLGLSMVAEIARWHGGEAGMENVPSGGSRFRITLPRAMSEPMTGAM
ncbi:MAG TPA: CHASE2 domain-containing protein [Thermoanaerobaculia bacterium]|jgi:signal transduction histidine kinase|nr:CHASE2 domain-containing protein [Thermoanaerobaculia bacterium]